MAEGKTRRSWRYRLARGVIILLVCAGTLVGIYYGSGALYHGPHTLAAVTAAMPGVPIFPLTSMAPFNISTQRALAMPLLLMRRQGAHRAEAALLQAPADREFIVGWYLQSASSQRWSLVANDTVGDNRRLVFLRAHEGLQVTVGATRNILTPVQLIYLEGLTDRLVAQLTPSEPLPEPDNPLFAGLPHHAVAPKPAAPPVKPQPVIAKAPVLHWHLPPEVTAAASASAVSLFPPAEPEPSPVVIAKLPSPSDFETPPVPAEPAVITPKKPAPQHVDHPAPAPRETPVVHPRPAIEKPAPKQPHPAPEPAPDTQEPVLDPPHPMEDQAAEYRP